MSDKGVYRTAPATPRLLIMEAVIGVVFSGKCVQQTKFSLHVHYILQLNRKHMKGRGASSDFT